MKEAPLIWQEFDIGIHGSIECLGIFPSHFFQNIHYILPFWYNIPFLDCVIPNPKSILVCQDLSFENTLREVASLMGWQDDHYLLWKWHRYKEPNRCNQQVSGDRRQHGQSRFESYQIVKYSTKSIVSCFSLLFEVA